MKITRIVIIPDMSGNRQALLYHTSCDRMTDLVSQTFQDSLQAPASLPQPASETRMILPKAEPPSSSSCARRAFPSEKVTGRSGRRSTENEKMSARE
jgi:hypothetical protein